MKKIALIASLLVLFAPQARAQIAADGTIIMRSTGGTVTTSEGVWSFGPGEVLLNGVVVGGGNTSEIEVAGGGVLYALNPPSNWFTHVNGVWSAAAAPPSTSPVTPPPPSGGITLQLAPGSAGGLANCPACSLMIPPPLAGPPGAVGPQGPQGLPGNVWPVSTEPVGRPITTNDNQKILKYTGAGTGPFPLPASTQVPQWFSFCFKAQGGPVSIAGLQAPDLSSFPQGSRECIGVDDQNPPNWIIL